ncbi:F-box protein At2g27310 [Cryptomeria japonica]|uniref:F-box protein At2g27310 n=1 Tax=Cryptomeria japonica TaxID=3369 RepID=UPI0027DA5D84|nr:F-box protein At2g27310 [Cryptomeria japonica]
MSLNSDIITDILGRVGGITLANAECASSHFRSIARQENLWEEKCCSVWPSTRNADIKELISSSLGGFKKFYADCFPVIANDGESNPREPINLSLNSLEDLSALHSDFVWVVDVVYKNKPIYSKVISGIPSADDFPGLFYCCPFRMEFINLCDVLDDCNSYGDGLPTISLQGKKNPKFWGHLMDNVRLSWILINQRTGQAINLSSWKPLVGRMEWPSQKDFVLIFGSILPSHKMCSSKFVQCGLSMKCRVSDKDHTSLKITELSMELEDMMGVRVNGMNSVVILENAFGCRRSKDHNQILQAYQKYLVEKSKLREMKMSKGGCADGVWIVSAIVALATFSYFNFIRSCVFF